MYSLVKESFIEKIHACMNKNWSERYDYSLLYVFLTCRENREALIYRIRWLIKADLHLLNYRVWVKSIKDLFREKGLDKKWMSSGDQRQNK